MPTLLKEAEPTVLMSCCADETLWESAKDPKSRKMCEYETDQECICPAGPDGGDCWLV
ncbi:MAG: hypothetical protein ABI662_05265 [Dermatophilaceae bacterium]